MRSTRRTYICILHLRRGATSPVSHTFRRKQISIHAPRVGRDGDLSQQGQDQLLFQSTRPVWGATSPQPGYARRTSYFNPRAPCGARRLAVYEAMAAQEISIHALRVGRDETSYASRCSTSNFNPRAPCGARRANPSRPHAARHFNPRAPCGARLAEAEVYAWAEKFQSTRPVWGATNTDYSILDTAEFQSTRPVWGATMTAVYCLSFSLHFNPRAPCGARLRACTPNKVLTDFNPRAPHGGATRAFHPCPFLIVISIHAPRMGARLRRRKPCLHASKFQSTRPAWGRDATPLRQ